MPATDPVWLRIYGVPATSAASQPVVPADKTGDANSTAQSNLDHSPASERTVASQRNLVSDRTVASDRTVSAQRAWAAGNTAAGTGNTVAGKRRGTPLHISLELSLENLGRLSRMFVEPDGSFLWSGYCASRGADWQLEGTIYDDGQVVQYVDLRGDCPLDSWHAFFAALGESMDSVQLQRLDCDAWLDGRWLQRRSLGEG